MFTITKSYVTKHGIDIKDWVLCIQDISFSHSLNGFVQHSLGEYPENLPTGNQYRSITYTVTAYSSAEGLAAGNLPIQVILQDGTGNFQVSNPKDFSTTSELVDMCVEHFSTLI